jgi:NADH-quinone oxidoreductase subunit C
VTPGEVLAEAARRLPAARCVIETGVTGAAAATGLTGPGGAGTGVGAAETGVTGVRAAGSGVGAAETGVGAAGTVTIDAPRQDWLAALAFARDVAGCDFFDWLTAVDELDQGFAVVAHLYSIESGQHMLVRTLVPREDPALPTATGLFRGAGWAERETHEMFGVVFDGHPGLAPLLLPEGFEGHPLRKDFPLAARAAQEWPGAREPGERAASARSRRRLVPPGVPEGWPPP